ncbi:MAG: DUF4097 family beta strand repeat protein [Clostridia bacterium]|nr:DUF4097 family beta strand repeat protein [Clostridia bacterium]
MNNKGKGLVAVVIVLAVICVLFLAGGWMLMTVWGGFDWWRNIPERLGEAEEYNISETQEAYVTDAKRFEVSSVSSDITVVFADTDKVTVKLEGSYRSSQGTVELKKKVSGDAVHIYVEYPKFSGMFTWNRTTLTVTVPRDMDENAMVLNSVSGNVAIFSGWELESLYVNTTSGNVNAEYITCDAFRYITVSGNLVLFGDIADRIDVETVSGKADMTLKSNTGAVRVNTVSGNVVARLEKDAAFKFSFSTVSGDFKSAFALFTQGGNNSRSGYTSDWADMDIDVNTVSGDLDIKY